MAEFFDEISPKLEKFIDNQKIFFVGTAGVEGRVNVSPKGGDSLRVLGPNKVAWQNLTGSGNESSAHVQQNGRMTIMFCAFEGAANILRLYGEAQVVHHLDENWEELIGLFPEHPGSRQVFVLDVDLVQTSCGYSVPFYDYKEDRTVLDKWTERKNRGEIEAYWAQKNAVTIDGYETNIIEKNVGV